MPPPQFWEALQFNGDTSKWDTSKVTTFATTFWDANSFNRDTSKWDTSKVTTLVITVSACRILARRLATRRPTPNASRRLAPPSQFGLARNYGNRDMSRWDTAKVTSMSGLFNQRFNGDVSKWDTAKVRSFHGTFGTMNARNPMKFNRDIGRWDTSSATTIDQMFTQAHDFNRNLCGWDVSNVRNFEITFFGANRFNQNLQCWDVSAGTDFSRMFEWTALSEEHKCRIMDPNDGWKTKNPRFDAEGATINADHLTYWGACNRFAWY